MLTKWSGWSPEVQRGVGVQDLQVKNDALLSKWLFKLLTEDGVWQTLFHKYLGQEALSQAYWKPGDSHFWFGLMAVKKHVFHFGSLLIKDGSEICFWEDMWLGNATLQEQDAGLYRNVCGKNDTLVHVLSSSPLNVSLRRDFIGLRLASWQHQLSRLDSIYLTQGREVFRWNLTMYDS